MTTLGWISFALVVVLLLATIAYQLDACTQPLSRCDPLRILPRWTFFAPNPATRDQHVVVRYKLADGTFTEWTPAIFAPPRAHWDVVWHPSKRPRKIQSDTIASVKRIYRATNSMASVQLSLPYIIILRHCVQMVPCHIAAVERQFAIVETAGRISRRLHLSFISDVHPC